MRASVLDASPRWSPPDPGLIERVGFPRETHVLIFNTTWHKETAVMRRRAETIRSLGVCVRHAA